MSKSLGYKGVTEDGELWVDATRVPNNHDIGSTFRLDGESVVLLSYWPRAHVYIYEKAKQ